MPLAHPELRSAADPRLPRLQPESGVVSTSKTLGVPVPAPISTRPPAEEHDSWFRRRQGR